MKYGPGAMCYSGREANIFIYTLYDICIAILAINLGEKTPNSRPLRSIVPLAMFNVYITFSPITFCPFYITFSGWVNRVPRVHSSPLNNIKRKFGREAGM